MEQEVRSILRRLVLIVRPHVPTPDAFFATVRLDLSALSVLAVLLRAMIPEAAQRASLI